MTITRILICNKKAPQVLVIALTADHGGVVAAQRQRRKPQPCPGLGAGLFQAGPDAAVGGNPARYGDFVVTCLCVGLHCPRDEGVGHGGGKGRGKVVEVQGLPLLLGVVDGVEHRCFQPGKGHIQRVAGHMGPGKHKCLVIAALGHLVHGASAGVAQTQHPGGLVEALPHGVVPGAA